MTISTTPSLQELARGLSKAQRAGDRYELARWDAEIERRFWAKVHVGPGCWLWTGTTSPKGYGTFSIDGRQYAAHRLLFVKQRKVKMGTLVCDHLCRVRNCVNPAHIEAVTNRENVRRGMAGPLSHAKGLAQTHCWRGHEYTPETTRRGPKGWRSCRICDRISNDAGQIRRAAASRTHILAEEQKP